MPVLGDKGRGWALYSHLPSYVINVVSFYLTVLFSSLFDLYTLVTCNLALIVHKRTQDVDSI